MSVKTKKLYAGLTNNLRNRLNEHNQGLVQSTRAALPWRLIYYEAGLEQSDAIRRERYLKTTHGKRLLMRRLKDYLYNQDGVYF